MQTLRRDASFDAILF